MRVSQFWPFLRSSRKYYHDWKPIVYLSGTHQRLWETDMKYQRPIGDLQAWVETDMPDWRPISLIEDQLAWSETDKLHQGCQMAFRSGMLASDQACRSLMWYIGHQWVSTGSPMGLLYVSDKSNIFMNSFLTRLALLSLSSPEFYTSII